MPESSARVGFRLGAFTIDLRARTLLRDDKAVALPARAFDALVFLITHRDRLVEKDEIVAAVWRDVAVTDDSLIHAVSVLRRALGDDPARPAFIETIPRHGYRFVGTVEELREPAAVPPEPAPDAVPVRRWRALPRPRLWSWQEPGCCCTWHEIHPRLRFA